MVTNSNFSSWLPTNSMGETHLLNDCSKKVGKLGRTQLASALFNDESPIHLRVPLIKSMFIFHTPVSRAWLDSSVEN